MNKIDALTLKTPFEMIGKDWMLITAQKDGKVNTMTASWGGMGVIWNKNVAFVFIRPSRYTKEFVDNTDSFSLSFFGEEYKDKLTYLGRTSGRDENKIEKAGLTVTHVNVLDGTVEGVECEADKYFSVQYRPEGAPGPADSGYLFDKFLEMM